MCFVPSCRLVRWTMSFDRDDSVSRGEAHKNVVSFGVVFLISLFDANYATRLKMMLIVVTTARPNNVFTITIEESKAALVEAAEALD
jgi:hypothetical protein